MFYINKWHRENSKELAIIHIGPPIIVLVAFLGITLWSWLEAENNIQASRSEVLENYLAETETEISNRLNTYESILRSGVGLFESSAAVDREDWKKFVDILEIFDIYPGIQGMGYAEIVPARNLSAHEAKYRDGSYPDYFVFPKSNKSLYTAVVYLEPSDEKNKKTVGFDMSSENTRREAMDLARDSEDITLSGVVPLLQEPKENPQPGLLMYAPIYKTGSQTSTIKERQANINGYVYISLRTHDFLNKITAELSLGGYSFQIHDLEAPSESKIYESPKYSQIENMGETLSSTKVLTVDNQEWTIKGIVDSSVVTPLQNSRPALILGIGTLLSIILSVFLYMLLLNRTRALSSKESEEIQNAKDELLALASHQLRTPATGVKQYLGLLREGYAGSLNKDQRLYINKAYKSNERQLNTINQMLFVARSDTGKIKLTIRRMDIVKLIKDVVDEQKSELKEKNHKLKLVIPIPQLDIYGDEQYLRMALENIINNAIKYTYNGGRIKIKVIPMGNQVKIEVEDNGVGISQEDLKLLFKKFTRIPNELTNKVSGSGIGLYLTQSIIKAHNGTINLESKADAGSRVTVLLPTKLPKESI